MIFFLRTGVFVWLLDKLKYRARYMRTQTLNSKPESQLHNNNNNNDEVVSMCISIFGFSFDSPTPYLLVTRSYIYTHLILLYYCVIKIGRKIIININKTIIFIDDKVQ